MPKLIWVNKRIPIVDASGAALENQSFEIRIKKPPIKGPATVPIENLIQVEQI